MDAKGMFLGAVGARPVYKLLGKQDLGTTDPPNGDCTCRRRHCVAATQRWTHQRPELADVPGIRQPLPQGDAGEDHERKN